MTSEDQRTAYSEAYAAWQKQLGDLHDVFLAGNRLDPVRLKGLLNRESRAKVRYDRARRALLGIEEDAAEADDGDGEEDVV